MEREDKTIIKLTQEQRLTFALGFAQLRDAMSRLTYRWLNLLPFPNCTSPARVCAGAGARMNMKLTFPATIYDAPDGLEDWSATWEEGLCKSCVTQAKAVHMNGRQEFWNALPGIFGLGSWKDMKKVSAL